MGEWQNVAFARGTIRAVRDALVSVFAEDGRALVKAPAPRKVPRSDPMQYSDGDGAPLWGVAIAPGKDGWAIVKTAPFEILCEKKGALMTRLAKKLRGEAFQLNLYDGVGLALLEADAKGKLRATGFSMSGDDPMSWNGFKMTEAQCTAKFGTVRVPPGVGKAMAGVSSVSAMSAVVEAFGGENAAFAGNETNLALVAHAAPEDDDVVVLFFEHAAKAPAKSRPLRVKVVQKTFGAAKKASKPESWGAWPDGTRLILAAGGGEAWIDGWSLVAPDAKRGAELLGAIARWLGVETPLAPEIPALLEPLYCSIEKKRDALLVRLGENEAVTLRLEDGALHETDPRLRQRVVDLLAPALAGPWRPKKEPIAIPTWHRFTDEPLYIASGAGFAGDALVAGASRGKRGVVLVSDEPGAGARDVATLAGQVAALGPSPDGAVAGACVTRAKHPASRGIGSDDDASIVLVDLANGKQRAVLTEVDPFTSILWSPDGSRLAVMRGRTTVAIDRAGKVLFTSKEEWEPAAWDNDGLLLVRRDYGSDRPPTWSRWSEGTRTASAKEIYASPGGRFHVTEREREKDIVIEGSGRTRKIPSRGLHVSLWRTPPVWLGKNAFVSLGDIPRIVSLTDENIVRLAPAAKDFRPCAATAKRVAAYHREGRLVWGSIRGTNTKARSTD